MKSFVAIPRLLARKCFGVFPKHFSSQIVAGKCFCIIELCDFTKLIKVPPRKTNEKSVQQKHRMQTRKMFLYKGKEKKKYCAIHGESFSAFQKNSKSYFFYSWKNMNERNNIFFKWKILRKNDFCAPARNRARCWTLDSRVNNNKRQMRESLKQKPFRTCWITK